MKSFLLTISETVSVALLVITGKYGNDDERKRKLTEEGYDYDLIQDCVNDLLPILNKYS